LEKRSAERAQSINQSFILLVVHCALSVTILWSCRLRHETAGQLSADVANDTVCVVLLRLLSEQRIRRNCLDVLNFQVSALSEI